MTMMKIDTLKFAKELEGAKDDPRATAEIIATTMGNADASHLATKADVADMKAEIFKQFWAFGMGIVGANFALFFFLMRAISQIGG